MSRPSVERVMQALIQTDYPSRPEVAYWEREVYEDRARAVLALFKPETVTTAAEDLVALSRWIDAANEHRDPEAVTWGRLAKITEEAGEVIEAFISATGQNPRKEARPEGLYDVSTELLDVAVTALGAYEHLNGHQGTAIRHLLSKISRVAERAGVHRGGDRG